jgi:protein-tyrosine phosphatase
MSNMLSRLLGRPFGAAEPDEQPPSAEAPRMRVLMVCMGNICRSPTAEAVLRLRLSEVGLADQVVVDSAGTHACHVGSAPDERSARAGAQRGYELTQLQARKVQAHDYGTFDLLLAMDWDNLALLEENCPTDLRKRLRRLTEFIPHSHPLAGSPVVPDPYDGGPDGFEHVLDLIEASVDGLVKHLQVRLAHSGEAQKPAQKQAQEGAPDSAPAD